MLTSKLFNIVDQYLEQAISLQELENWLVPKLPFFFQLPYSSGEELVTEIEVGLAEINDKTLTEEAFRNSLREFLNKQTTFIFSYPDVIAGDFESSSNQPFFPLSVPEYTTAGFSSVPQ